MVKKDMFITAGIITLSSMVFYHVVLKMTPKDINPFMSLFIAYAIAGTICLIAFLVFRNQNSLSSEFSKLNWTTFVLGIFLVGIELGLLFLYRNGSNISTTSLTLSSMMTIVLLIVGTLFFSEVITLKSIIGLVICVIGLWLIQSK